MLATANLIICIFQVEIEVAMVCQYVFYYFKEIYNSTPFLTIFYVGDITSPKNLDKVNDIYWWKGVNKFLNLLVELKVANVDYEAYCIIYMSIFCAMLRMME